MTATTSIDAEIVPYPPELADEYRRSGAWPPTTIAAAFRATADVHRDREAIVTTSEVITYAELDERSDVAAAGLHDLGLRPGDRVLLQTTNTGLAAVAWYAILKAGLVPIATLPHHREHEIFEIARQAEPAAHLIQVDFPGHDLVALASEAAATQPSLRHLLTIGAAGEVAGGVELEKLADGGDGTRARELVNRIQATIAADALAVLQLSGGTTNVPKLIPRLHGEYWYNAARYADVVELGAGDCALHLLPLVHNAGIVCGLHAAHAVGASMAMCAYQADELKALSRRRVPTHMFMAPPIAQMVFADAELTSLLRGLRRVVWTLGKLPPQVLEAFETDSCLIQQLYGQGEGLCMVTPADAPAEIRRGTVGRPLSPQDEVRICEPGTETELPAGEPGELCCRGPYTVRGYFRGGERNVEAFTSDGFYRSGDIAVRLDAPGGPYYAIEDRLKDVISRGGEKINALEVEGLLVRHPSIKAAALAAMPDERLGERACAFVVLAQGADPVDVAEVRRFLDGLGVAKFKWPERIEIRDALPLTSVDKVNKAELRKEIAELLDAEQREPGISR